MKVLLIIIVIGIISFIILAVSAFIKFGKMIAEINDKQEQIFYKKFYEKNDVHKIVDEIDEEHRKNFDEL